MVWGKDTVMAAMPVEVESGQNVFMDSTLLPKSFLE